jgi:antitoxin MazE
MQHNRFAQDRWYFSAFVCGALAAADAHSAGSPSTTPFDKQRLRDYNVSTLRSYFVTEAVMSTVIKTRLVKIGNSQGLRIPKLLLEQLNLPTDVELEVQDDHLIVRPSSHPRADWAEQFRQMAQRADDRLLDSDLTLTEWEASEWQW